MKTRCKDKNREWIWEGDVISVEQYPDKFVGGSLSFEGVVSIGKDGKAYVTYYDIGEEESFLIDKFPMSGREILSEEESREYWRTACLGEEPPEVWWKRELYRV